MYVALAGCTKSRFGNADQTSVERPECALAEVHVSGKPGAHHRNKRRSNALKIVRQDGCVLPQCVPSPKMIPPRVHKKKKLRHIL